jgi:cysteinyl-tRNA synthetase
MEIQLYNTLTKKKETFKPLKKGFFGRPKVGIYHCGPTVYDFVHIGNLRAAVFADTVRRVFEASGYKVSQVMNITDIGHLQSDADEGEDKMTNALKREGKSLSLESMKEIADRYTKAFLSDIEALNVKIPHKLPKASEHVKEQLAIISALDKKGLVYKTSDGVYFDTAKISDYGKLGGVNYTAGESRIGTNSEKRNPQDFALWKFNEGLGWNSTWGKGFPGWHIECSAMAMKYLGETFDVHTGGIEHIPVHHNNEIAQSEHSTDKPFARYWLHNAHLVMSHEKMAKSVGNVVYLKTIRDMGYSPMDLRYFFLGARYSTTLNFTYEALDAARTALKRLTAAVCELPRGGKVNKNYWDRALSYASDDLDTSKVLALQWEILKDTSLSPADKKATILKIDSLLGLAKPDDSCVPANAGIQNLPPEVIKLATLRESARSAKDWKKSDDLRDQLSKLGYEVKDTSEGQKVVKKIGFLF